MCMSFYGVGMFSCLSVQGSFFSIRLSACRCMSSIFNYFIDLSIRDRLVYHAQGDKSLLYPKRRDPFEEEATRTYFAWAINNALPSKHSILRKLTTDYDNIALRGILKSITRNTRSFCVMSLPISLTNKQIYYTIA